MLKKTGALSLVFVIAFAVSALAQRITGSITGQVMDPQEALVAGATIAISNHATGYKLDLAANNLGNFVVTDLPPGTYKVTIEAPGFASHVATVPVRVGMATPVTARLTVGAVVTEVEVEATAATVDTTRQTVQGVVTGDRIDQIPLNGRNFLALATLEPGVQIVDGGTFDPRKNQYAGVSIGGRSGRVTRIQVDGVDISDETVGTTVANLSNESIQEFGVSQSSLDPSTSLTSSGAVNIITRSGTNSIHGSGFGFFRDARFAADQRLDKTAPTTEKPPFDRQNFGGRAGGPFVKDKLFWHVEYEQFNQDARRFTSIPAPFSQFSGAFRAPLDEKTASGRLDWNVTNSAKLFYRFIHNDNVGVTGFGGRDLGAFSNRNSTNIHVAGVNYATGRWVHQGRFSYLNFNNFIEDANGKAGTPLTLDPIGRPITVSIASALVVGPDPLAPQSTFQDSRQTKYDGSYVFGRQTLRFGGEWDKIDGFLWASLFGLAPRLRTSSLNAAAIAFAAAGPFPGGSSNPLNYPVNRIALGNGLGFASERPALGFPHGGTTNHRLGFYVDDSWRARPDLTLNFGLRWNWNSAQSNHDLARTPTIGLFDQNLLGTPRRPGDNFAPQAGFAWNVDGQGKMVIRGGAGIFFETNIINNYVFDRVLNIPPGLGLDVVFARSAAPRVIDPGTGATLFNFATDCSTPTGSCFNQPIGSVVTDVYNALGLYQAASAALAANWPKPGGPPLFDQVLDTRDAILDTDYKTPYGIQFNIGVQREIKPGLVLSVDYLHNRGVHFDQVVDRNRIGAADTLDVAMANAAIAATLADFGCADIACVITNGGTIRDFASHGLGAGSALDGFAFRGMNPNFRRMGIVESIGLSRFQALQVRLTGRLGTWGPFKSTTTNITYQLGRFNSTGDDQDFGFSASAYNDQPTKFYGPAGIDRLHQIGISFTTDLPWGFRISTVTQLKTGLATSMRLPPTTAGADEIFFSDLNGDGTTQDPLPGTNRGSYGQDVNADSINRVIDTYNATFAGTLTPAGRALVNAGLFTEAQLIALGAVATSVSPAPSGQVNNDSFSSTDIRVSRRIKLGEQYRLEAMVEFFNLFNIANYESLTPKLDGSAGSINGTTSNVDQRIPRVGFGSGSFSPGTMRAIQFGVRFTF